MDRPKVSRDTKYTDYFKRKTAYISQDLMEMLIELSSTRKGEQTRIMNAALSEYLRAASQPRRSRPERADCVRKTFYVQKDLLKEFDAFIARTGEEQATVFHSALVEYFNDPANLAKHEASTDWYAKPFWRNIRINE